MRTFKLFGVIALVVLIVSCGSKTTEELFVEGAKLLEEKKYDEALVIFENLAKDRKESEFAPKALFECAKLYQGKVIKNLEANESLNKSVEVYKQIFENYPSYEEAGNSLFMAGFIQANELNQLDKAKETYELYLEKFPDGQLADDAKVELQNLGKTPEEILMEKLQNESDNEKNI